MIAADEVRGKINEAVRSRVPCLFGVDYELCEGFFTDRPLEQRQYLFRAGEAANYRPQKPETAVWTSFPEPYGVYRRRFETVMAGLKRGNSFLANLTVRTPVSSNLTLEQLFRGSVSHYGLLIPGRMACFSPERFVRIADGRISSNPMKGTIDAAFPDAETVILNDYKETAEHYTIVDLIRNDLSRVADDVEVKRFRYVDRIDTGEGTILQVSSEIEGRLSPAYAERVGDALFELLPAGSICGAPKEATVRLIAEAERTPRGFYTGIFGYYDGRVLDTAVLIRYVEQTPGGLVFRSGGGITVNSVCRSEYREACEKVYFPILR